MRQQMGLSARESVLSCTRDAQKGGQAPMKRACRVRMILRAMDGETRKYNIRTERRSRLRSKGAMCLECVLACARCSVNWRRGCSGGRMGGKIISDKREEARRYCICGDCSGRKARMVCRVLSA